MKITYTVMPTGGPVRSIDSGDASAARRAVKTTLKNLKRWCARLRHGTATRDFKDSQQNRLEELEIPYNGNTMMTMVVDQEESRNRANENLENERRESLAISPRHTVPSTMTTADVKPVSNGLAEDDEPPVKDLLGVKIIAGVLRGVTRT